MPVKQLWCSGAAVTALNQVVRRWHIASLPPVKHLWKGIHVDCFSEGQQGLLLIICGAACCSEFVAHWDNMTPESFCLSPRQCSALMWTDPIQSKAFCFDFVLLLCWATLPIVAYWEWYGWALNTFLSIPKKLYSFLESVILKIMSNSNQTRDGSG